MSNMVYVNESLLRNYDILYIIEKVMKNVSMVEFLKTMTKTSEHKNKSFTINS